jgi:hypothetical protein
MCLSLMNMLGLSSSVHFAHITCYWKFFLLHYRQVLSQYRLCRADNAYLTYLMLQRQLSHLNGRKIDQRQVQASNIFCVWLHFFPYREHVHSNDSVWLLLVACTIFLYNRTHTEGWKLCADRGPVRTLQNFHSCLQPCLAGAAILRDRCLPYARSSNGSWTSLYSLGTDRTENTASNSSSIVTCVSVAAIT